MIEVESLFISLVIFVYFPPPPPLSSSFFFLFGEEAGSVDSGSAAVLSGLCLHPFVSVSRMLTYS